MHCCAASTVVISRIKTQAETKRHASCKCEALYCNLHSIITH